MELGSLSTSTSSIQREAYLEGRRVRSHALKRSKGRPADVVEAANRLHAFLDQRCGGSPQLREWPVHAAEDLQVISRKIDRSVDRRRRRFTVSDHKRFPGAMALDDGHLKAFGGQVHLYARALRQGARRECRDYWIHQPIAGLMLRVELVVAEAA